MDLEAIKETARLWREEQRGTGLVNAQDAACLVEEVERLREWKRAARIELARHLCFTNHAAQRDFWSRVEDRALSPQPEGAQT